MPAPTPLTACDPPQLDWSRPTAPAASDFGDIYFSVDGGLEEAETVFLKGCGLPDAWQDKATFAIGELGFGSGLNFLVAWRLWERTKPQGGRLHFISVEKFPFDKQALSRALGFWPELETYSDRLIAVWPGQVRGLHTIHIAPDVTLTLIHDDIETALDQIDAKINAWFLDGFSPAKNPGMWSEKVMQYLAQRSAPGARVGTFTVAGAVRQALISAGFVVEKKQGFGRKRHRLEAHFPGQPLENTANVKPLIIGAGIGGASLARSFLRRGIIPIVIDAEDGTAASGNPAAIVKPRLDLQERPESLFFLASYLYALRAYHDHGCILSTGVYHLAKADADMKRFEKLVKQAALPPEHMFLDEGPYDAEGLYFADGLVIDPVVTCSQFLKGATRLKSHVSGYQVANNSVTLYNNNAEHIATGTHVFLAAGAGIKTFYPANIMTTQTVAIKDTALRYSRGQVTTVDMTTHENLTYGGYAVALGAHTLLGATHSRLKDENPYVATDEDDQKNIEQFEQISGQKLSKDCGPSRASVRVTTPNTLPSIIDIQERITALTGLGSRGFVFAPLLAEDIVASVCGEPGALTQQQRQAFRRERSPT